MNLDGHAPRCKSAGAGHSRLDDGGFVLVALLIGIAVASIWMAAALPSWRQQVIRQREHELIFRGQQYARAIRLYQAQMGNTLPTSIDDLVSQHFLRRKYKDPITNDEFLPRVGCQQVGMPGMPGQRGTPIPPGRGAPVGGPRGQSAFPPVEMMLAQAPGRGGPPFPGPGRGGPPQIPGRGGPPTIPGRGGAPPVNPGFPGQVPGGMQGGGICGVQSKSKATSIVIYNGQQQHDLWQFDTQTAGLQYARAIARLGGGIQPGGMPGGVSMPGRGGPTQGRPGQNPNIPGRGFGPGGQFPPGGGQPMPPGGQPTFPGGRRGP